MSDPTELDPVKSALRASCWAAIRTSEVARFPGVEGRIPNFVGAEAAAKRLAESPLFTEARVLKVNPDSPQRPVRHAALKAGKLLVLPVPRLQEDDPFLLLDPEVLGPKNLWRASSIAGAFELGTPTRLEDVPPLDLIVTGCVGVTAEGARLGKGGGYSDVEYALLRQAGLVHADTPIVTTVHSCQVLPDGAIPMTAHDISLDLIVTEAAAIPCARPFERPEGLLEAHLSDDKAASIPVLAQR